MFCFALEKAMTDVEPVFICIAWQIVIGQKDYFCALKDNARVSSEYRGEILKIKTVKILKVSYESK